MTRLPFAGILRILVGTIIVGMAIGFGVAHRSPWILPVLGVAFTMFYITGKLYAWRPFWTERRWGDGARALLQILPVQCVVVSVFYLIGLGVGKLTGDHSLAEGVTPGDVAVIAAATAIVVAISVVIDRLEGGEGPLADLMQRIQARSRGGVESALDEKHPDAGGGDADGDFIVLPDPITPQTLFSKYRGHSDYTKTALIDKTEYNGSRPVRANYAANDLAIAEAERRLGFTFPEGLKNLYKVKDGGHVNGVRVAVTENPRPVYDDFKAAFGGYEEMYSLGQLCTVYDSILNFADEDDVDAFPEGAKKMLILSQWYQETTFLDYRHGGEPRVGLVDFDNENWESSGLWFDNFDAFFSSLVGVDEDYGRKAPPLSLTRKGPVADHPDGFWSRDGAADHGADAEIWATAEARLGVALPAELRPYLAAVNGGAPRFCYLPEFGGDFGEDGDDGEPLNVFPGKRLLGVCHWTSLRELSDRLEFCFGAPPWADIWEGCDKLIVIAGSFDAALMLDYREGAPPEVLYASNLDNPDDAVVLGSVGEFLNCLRAAIPTGVFVDQQVIGDVRLSARAPRPDTFWSPGGGGGLSEADVAAHETRLDHELASPLKDWMLAQNGGRVRFRYVPPVVENMVGHSMFNTVSGDWFDMFPDGVRPIETWETLADWLRVNPEDLGDALRRRGFSQYVEDEFGDPAHVLVLAEGENRLTLLDYSRTNYPSQAQFVQLAKGKNGWDEACRSVTVRDFDPRARRDEL